MESTNPSHFYKIIRVIPVILFGGIIFYLSSLSQPYAVEPPKEIINYLNYFLHIVEFAIFSFLAFFGLYKRTHSLNIIIICFLYVFSDEIHQYFVPLRYFDFVDILLDIIGIIIGYLFYLLTIKIKHKFSNKK